MSFLIRMRTFYPGNKRQTTTTTVTSKQSERRRDIYVLVPSRAEISQIWPPPHLLVFLVGLLGNQLGLGQLSLQDGDPVVLHVALIL